ncbi:flavodoxin family protein [Candidatus Avoscillospira sp. LCP25S3_F1]|uniref:flavodoxin family protein n=1 Tax=Candidatus Avoscillospira sp. LCP25S3_F1 TaxID=3438825 RepID=UPI003F924D0E
MNLLLTDRPLAVSLPEGWEMADLSQKTIAPCLGCFGCWTKTPGRCVLRDDAVDIYPRIAKSSRVLYVSAVVYGGYDVPMKTMLERAIPVQKPFIRLLDGETHHVQRAVTRKQADIVAYGADTEEERDLFRRLVQRNAKNMSFADVRIHFTTPDGVEKTVEEVLSK